MRIGFHPLVAKDWDEIMDYYERISPRAALKFDEQFSAQLAATVDHPTRFSSYHGSTVFRRARLPNFPHLLIFGIIRGGIRVTLIKHEKRHPGSGMRRK
jgi:plasmid stabilization system protein ParE